MERKPCLWTLLVVLVVASCGQIPSALPAYDPSPEVTQPSESLPLGPTNLPYPAPTREPWPGTRTPRIPTPLPGPGPILLGTDAAPAEEQITYDSTVVVVAPAGDGPGQVGLDQTGSLAIGAFYFTVDADGNIYILDEVNRRVVQFDPQGRFVVNLVFGDAIAAPQALAATASGQVFIYDASSAGHKIGLLDREGSLVRDYPIPSWLSWVKTMQVDASGILWAEGMGIIPGAPFIEFGTYSFGAVALGNSEEVFTEEYQERSVVPGHLCDSGKTIITYQLGEVAYAYNLRGERIYEIPGSTPICIDGDGNLYGITSSAPGLGHIVWWNPQGKRIASVDYPGGATLVKADGTIYSFVVDWEENLYRVTRLRPGR